MNISSGSNKPIISLVVFLTVVTISEENRAQKHGTKGTAEGVGGGNSSPWTWHLKDSPENTFKGNRELAKASESQKKPGSQKCLIGNICIPFPAEWLTPSGPVHNSEAHQS